MAELRMVLTTDPFVLSFKAELLVLCARIGFSPQPV